MNPVRRNLVLILTIAILMAGVPTSATAQIEEVTLQVDGLSCPFCVNGVEKHLKKVEGVNEVVTNLKKGEVRLHYKFGALFNVATLQDAVVKGGFTPGPVTLTAKGMLEKRKEFVFTVTDTKLAFLLHPTPTKKKNKTGDTALSAATVAKLEKAIADKKRVEISGEVHSHKDSLPGLSITELKVIGDE